MNAVKKNIMRRTSLIQPVATEETICETID